MTESRQLPGTEVGDLDDTRHEVLATVCVYDLVDAHSTVWRPGVFTDSLRAKLPPICLHHDLARPIGRAVEDRDSRSRLDLRMKMADVRRVPDAALA